MPAYLLLLALLTSAHAENPAAGGPGTAVAAAPLRRGDFSDEDFDRLSRKLGLAAPCPPGLASKDVLCDPATGKALTERDRPRLRRALDGELPAASPVSGASAAEHAPDPAHFKTLEALRGPNVFGGARDDGLGGPLPKDNDFMRGVDVAAEGASVLRPGRKSLGVRYSAANNLLREYSGNNSILLKNEVHTAVVDYRAGLNTRIPVEVGVSVSAASAGEGYLNGFIATVENHVFAPLFGPSAINGNRTGPYAMTGTAQDVSVGGRRTSGDGTWGAQLGDIVGVVKASLPVGSCSLCELAARGVVTYAAGGRGGSMASSVGLGVSGSRPLGDRWSAFADARVAVPASSHDRAGLAVHPAAGATVGVSYQATPKLALTIQNDYNGSPYRGTGLPVYDNAYTSVTFGLAYRLTRKTVLKFSGSEDYNTGRRPAGQDLMAPYGPSDFGVTASLQTSF